MSTIAAAALAADRIDNWIRGQVMQYWLRHNATDFVPGDLAISFVDTCVGPPPIEE